MGLSTTGILTKGTTLEKIIEAISAKYTDVTVYSSSSSDFFKISYCDSGDDIRILSISFANYCESDYGISGVWVSLGFGGSSMEVVTYLCTTLGGYYRSCDNGDDDFQPINTDLYLKGTDLSERDLFVHEIIAELGYINLKKSLKIFDKFIK